MFHFDDICAGPIDGLSLPPMAWDVLRREEIQTIDQLMAKAGCPKKRRQAKRC